MRTFTGFGAALRSLMRLIAAVLGGPTPAISGRAAHKERVLRHPMIADVALTTVKDLEVTVDYLKHPNGEYIMGSAMRVDELLREGLKDEGWRLPTPHEVDMIWNVADVRLVPIFMPPVREMQSASYQRVHQTRIEGALQFHPTVARLDNPLIAGHKKDLVIGAVGGRTTIYGWHRGDGTVVQPVSSVHGYSYHDYSQGIRLVRPLRRSDEEG